MAFDDSEEPIRVTKPKKLDEMSVSELEDYNVLLNEEIERVKNTIKKKKSALLDAAKIFG